jgi:hypothetical protein
VRWQSLALLSVLAGCFSPDPPEGVSCSETGKCPPGQACALGVCRSAAGNDAAIDATTPPDDGGAPDASSLGDIGSVCAVDVDCGSGLSCFLNGPGRNGDLGFCTTSCTPGPDGDADCKALDPDLALICFRTAQLVGVCAISCLAADDSCPEGLDCQLEADADRIICDVSSDDPMPPPLDGGGPPPGDAGV